MNGVSVVAAKRDEIGTPRVDDIYNAGEENAPLPWREVKVTKERNAITNEGVVAKYMHHVVLNPRLYEHASGVVAR